MNELKFKKHLFFTKTRLLGQIKINNLFQIYPLILNDMPSSTLQNHFPNIMEFTYNNDDKIIVEHRFPELKEIIDSIASSTVKFDLLLLLLTTGTNHLFFKLESIEGNWGIPITSENYKDYENAESIWCLPLYFTKELTLGEITDFTPITFDNVNLEYYDIYFFGNINPDVDKNKPLTIPNILHQFIRSYFKLSNDVKEKVRNAMYCLKSGIELQSSRKSIALLSIFTALETMVDIENSEFVPETCESCGQQKFAISKKFKKFLSKYVSTNPDYNSKYNKLYSLRSKIVHTGDLLKSEHLFNEATLKKIDDEALTIQELIQICRFSIVRWVIHNSKQID